MQACVCQPVRLIFALLIATNQVVYMNVEVLAFGIAKEIFSSASVHIPLQEGASAGELKTALEQAYPRLQQLKSWMLAVNNEYAAADTPIGEGDEIALIPPVSGG